jgi:hypothetical protein
MARPTPTAVDLIAPCVEVSNDITCVKVEDFHEDADIEKGGTDIDTGGGLDSEGILNIFLTLVPGVARGHLPQ